MSLALRPRWSTSVAAPSRDVIDRLATRLADGPLQLKRSRVPGGGGDTRTRERDFFTLTVPAAEQHVWSPWLSIDVMPAGGDTTVYAQFSPHPSVWTGFAFAYLVLGTGLAVSLVIAASGALVPGSDQTWALWLAGGLAAVMTGLWTAAQVGHRLAREQMQILREAMDRALAA